MICCMKTFCSQLLDASHVCATYARGAGLRFCSSHKPPEDGSSTCIHESGHLDRVCSSWAKQTHLLSSLLHFKPFVQSPAMAAGCLPEQVQEHRSAAWRQGVKARLAKKATFEAAVADLVKALHASPAAASDPAVAELIERSFTLLRTRYTAPGFWSAGRALYASAVQASIQHLAHSLFT